MTPAEPYDLDEDASRLDFIGDVHGCAQTLERLLEQMGYRHQQGVYAHAQRKAVFVGDILDRGPRIREALALVREMVERGSAYLILGNHEINALCYCTVHPSAPGNYLRPHTPRNTRIISETLEQFAHHNDEWRDHLQWLARRPLYLRARGANIVHACWDSTVIEARTSAVLDESEWLALADPSSMSAQHVKRLTSGIELPLPEGRFMLSAEGYKRRSFRAKFWEQAPQTLGDLAFQPDPLPAEIAALAIKPEIDRQLVVYDSRQPPLFLGHYWLSGVPQPVAPNIACLDYSAVKFGRLVAYRGDGAQRIHPDNYAWVYVDP
ncbi:metallophosphoesterase [Gilvimarinus algae]|uniref:Metallophosphoesterase n=1 Tax=Gilvimarinus algae TaxID=3058037 RepID=A0ABT8TIK3_9GAMM|nr:metallophosphoesterase [Gilvimarinus sp. SDUM040014]MDO3382511.1 metallophosphoesterase [Gilvimarinus sp. SDUM040014]